ncbi:hypothetical protein CALCODRAFT_490450 [Calocera cornea HHB12733]|uniref:Uncharacterized protein n=1 Tax=Calocera cornea HHB12733 TaxID=1353952 RepID=A0A165JJH8_9BASI|nr:hypothetical protein CALCODRAFT_490450 [Calocera cornea HHB12733]
MAVPAGLEGWSARLTVACRTSVGCHEPDISMGSEMPYAVRTCASICSMYEASVDGAAQCHYLACLCEGIDLERRL